MAKYELKLDGAEVDEITLNKHGDKIEIINLKRAK